MDSDRALMLAELDRQVNEYDAYRQRVAMARQRTTCPGLVSPKLYFELAGEHTRLAADPQSDPRRVKELESILCLP